MRYTEHALQKIFARKSLRVRFETAEGSMMIDPSTIASLELVQNAQNAKSRECLLGLLNNTLTPMGARFLRANILQPSTDVEKINKRQDAIEQLSKQEHTLSALRDAMRSFVDSDRILAALVVMPTKPDSTYTEQSVNNVLMLKTFVDSIAPIWRALGNSNCEELSNIHQLCSSENYAKVENIILETIDEDVHYSTKPTDLRNQRVYAIRAGVDSVLDVARQTYKEINEDVYRMVEELKVAHELPSCDLKFDTARQYFLRINCDDSFSQNLPEILINIFRRPKYIECQTLDLVKMNQKMRNAHADIIHLGDGAVQQLIGTVRCEIHPLFKISEAIALLDMLSSLAQLSIINNYTRPEITDTLGLEACRHPLREKIQLERFVPNHVYATQQTRFQIITGCNMSGKSTYIRSIALAVIMAQMGSFVPASSASLPIIRNLFARASTDDSIEANISSFSGEMREMAFILRTISEQSLVIIDELGRGTSTTDGLAIAIAIAEALVESKALVWFVTHFRDLPRILAERAGVVNHHLAVDIGDDLSKMTMRYQISDGYEEKKFYGLALAKVVGLPEPVLDVAESVSRSLNDRNDAQKRNPKAAAEAKRRKLLLNLREHLVQARDSCATGQTETADRRAWLMRLQDDFALGMRDIDIEAGEVVEGDGDGDTEATPSDEHTDTVTDTDTPGRRGRHKDAGIITPGASMMEEGGMQSNGKHHAETLSDTRSSSSSSVVEDVDRSATVQGIKREDFEERHEEEGVAVAAEEHDSDTTTHVDTTTHGSDDHYADEYDDDDDDDDEEMMMLDHEPW
ncbi:MutS protein msh4 [Exophiala oligosperma]